MAKVWLGSYTVENAKLKYGCFFSIQNAEIWNCWGFMQ